LKGAEVVGVIALLSAGEITVHEDSVTTEETITGHVKDAEGETEEEALHGRYGEGLR
jgi:hypothetical protein